VLQKPVTPRPHLAHLKIDRQRWVDRVAGPPLCWLLTLFHRLTGVDDPPREVRRILVVLLSEMGALVLTRPMFDRLREKHPSATFHVLCFEQNRAALDLLDIIPANQVIVVRNTSAVAFAIDSFRATRRMRSLRLDVVLDLELFARASAIFAGLSGAAIRVGFHRYTQEGLYRGDFMNRPVQYNPYQHIAQQFVRLADAIGSTTVPTAKQLSETAPLRLSPLLLHPGELEAARRRLRETHPSIADRPLVFLGPGGGLLPIRAWPAVSFARVAKELTARGLAVAIIGLSDDRELAQTIQRACGSPLCIDLTGYTRSVRDLTVLLHLGALLITNDGGTGHFASLTPIPAIVFFGPETPVLYGILSPRAVNMFKPVSCSPCLTAYNHRRSPCDGDNVCLKAISPEEVLTAAYELLGAVPLEVSPKPQVGEGDYDHDEIHRRH
jgi:ADP-heptose:LPS heptosyltransferase